MSQYVDGFVIPIKKKNLPAYKKMAAVGCKVWMEHGALAYFECHGDDLSNDLGVNFKKLCKLKADETAIFAFIIYKSKAQRDRINKKVHADPRMQAEKFPHMPFDMERMTSGGFKALLGKQNF